MPKTISINGNNLNLQLLSEIAQGASISLSTSVKPPINKAQKLVAEIAKSDAPTYGVNTGFGFFARKKISRDELAALQVNLLKSHACGYGSPLSIPETRAAMVLRLNVLIKGLTGVRYEVCDALLKLIQAEIYPVIPEYGSVGASGDLAPLSHLALPLIGEGTVLYKGHVMPAAEALKKAKLKPIILQEKEGLGLINGTQIMLSVGGIALIEAFKLLDAANRICALTYEGMCGRISALDPRIHKARGQIGQEKAATAIREELKQYQSNPRNVQDPYSMRCAPQVHGTSWDALDYVKTIVERELNAATDNPLVFTEDDSIVSGGNFHGQPLAMAFDFAAIAVAELGSISERRLELLMNPHMSGLNAFLTPYEGTHSGYMAAQYLSASLVNENKILANPACVDTIPGNVGMEDHVSMGMTSARKFRKVVKNCRAVLAAELVAAAQAIDIRKIKPTGKGTKATYKALRKKVKTLITDRIIAEDIESAIEVIREITHHE